MKQSEPLRDSLDDVLAELERARTAAPAAEPETEPEPSRRAARAPEVLGRARWVPPRSAAVLLALSALVAAAIFTARWLIAEDGSTPAETAGRVSVTGRGSSAASFGSSSGSSVSPSSSASTSASRWRVHVVGAVRHPGVVEVAAAARVADAVAAAGGLAPGADAGSINLARLLADGEQVHVPRPGETWTPPSDAGASGPGAAASSGSREAGGGGASKGIDAAGGTVRLNEATADQLDSLPGVGPVMAQRIIDWRKEHGRFTSVDELGEVAGIGDKTLERLRPKVSV